MCKEFLESHGNRKRFSSPLNLDTVENFTFYSLTVTQEIGNRNDVSYNSKLLLMAIIMISLSAI